MKFNTKDILSNQWVLYVVAFLSLTSVFGYLMNHEYPPILFFILVAFLTNYFSKNMIVILSIALIATNLLASITNIFGPQNVKEGLENQSADPCSSHKDPSSCKNISGCSWNNSTGICDASAPVPTTSNASQSAELTNFKKAKQKEASIDNLEGLYDNDTIRNMTKETNSLMKQQNDLMQQMKDIGPLVTEAMGALQNLGSGNMVDMFSSLSGSLNKFKDKYPDAFPENYDEKTAQINELIAQAKEINKQYPDDASKAKAMANAKANQNLNANQNAS